MQRTSGSQQAPVTTDLGDAFVLTVGPELSVPLHIRLQFVDLCSYHSDLILQLADFVLRVVASGPHLVPIEKSLLEDL